MSLQESILTLEVLEFSGLVLLDSNYFGGIGRDNLPRLLFNVNTQEELNELNPMMNAFNISLNWHIDNVVLASNVYSTFGPIREITGLRDIIQQKIEYLQKQPPRYKSNTQRKRHSHNPTKDKRGMGYLNGLWKSLHRTVASLKPYEGRREPIFIKREDVDYSDYELVEFALGHILDHKNRVSIISGDTHIREIVSDVVTRSHKRKFGLLEKYLFLYVPSKDGDPIMREMDIHECADFVAGTTDSLRYLSVSN